MFVETSPGSTILTLSGTVDDAAEQALRAQIDKVIASRPTRLVLRVETLDSISARAVRAIAFSRSKLDLDEDVFVVGANASVQAAFEAAGLWEELTPIDRYDSEQFGS